MERKKIGQIQIGISRRRLACKCHHLYTKYDILACKVVEKSLTKKCYGVTEGWTDGRTDGRIDGMTDRCKPVDPPSFSERGYKYLIIYYCI